MCVSTEASWQYSISDLAYNILSIKVYYTYTVGQTGKAYVIKLDPHSQRLDLGSLIGHPCMHTVN